jgi:hypothetical protein
MECPHVPLDEYAINKSTERLNIDVKIVYTYTSIPYKE